jgi:hypothetical protein
MTEEFEEEAVEVVGELAARLSWRRDPLSFALLALSAHCVLFLGLRGFGPLASASVAVLVWTACRYLVVRGSALLGTPNPKGAFFFRPAVLAPSFRTSIDAGLARLVAVLEWRDARRSLLVFGGAAALGVALHWANATVGLYLLYLWAVASTNL